MRTDLLSDWAVLSVEATLVPDCVHRSNSESDGMDTVTLWPDNAAFWGLRAGRRDATRPALPLPTDEADRRFRSRQSGSAGSRGRLLELTVVKGEPELWLRPTLAAEERITIEYTALLPTQYRGGVHRLELPEPPAARMPEIMLGFPRGGELVSVDRTAGVLTWRPTQRGLDVELLGAEMPDGRYRLGWRVRAASTLGLPPENARLVVVIDTSRSLTSEELRHAVREAGEFIAAHPNATAAIVSFDGEVRVHGAGLMTQTQARSVLERFPLERRNGSVLELGLAQAARLLRRGTGPARVLLLSDGHLRPSVTEPALRRSFPVVEHALLVRYLGRDDYGNALLDRLVERHHGHRVRGRSECALRELVAPVRVEELRLGLDPESCASGPLGSGEAISPRMVEIPGEATTNQATLQYRLWSDWYTVAATLDPVLSHYERAWRNDDACQEPPLPPAPDVLGPTSFFVALPGRVAEASALPRLRGDEAWVCGGDLVDGCEDHFGDFCGDNFTGETEPLEPEVGQWLLGEAWGAAVLACGASNAAVTVRLDRDEVEEVLRVDSRDANASVRRCLGRAARSLSVPEGEGWNDRDTVIIRYPAPAGLPPKSPRPEDRKKNAAAGQFVSGLDRLPLCRHSHRGYSATFAPALGSGAWAASDLRADSTWTWSPRISSASTRLEP